mmetsp:Transcript_27620/g.70626  ORF Transcript_27620/g.70626 Transcript_27620/m.70626 type:complete len:177 (-) Transcript_27620:29-559(-)
MRVQQRMADSLGVQLEAAVHPLRPVLRTSTDRGSPSHGEDISTQMVNSKPLVDSRSPVSFSRSPVKSNQSKREEEREENQEEKPDEKPKNKTENEEEGPFAPTLGDHDFASVLRCAYEAFMKEKKEHPLEVDETGRLKGCSDPRTWLGYGFIPDVDKQPTTEAMTETKTTPRSRHP